MFEGREKSGGAAAARDGVGDGSRHEFAQDHAEGEDIAPGRGRFAAPLLRRRVARRHGCQRRAAFAARRARRFVQPRGRAEVEQADPSRPVDEDVGGLEVTVHHQIAVRVLDGRADLQEQREPGAKRRVRAAAVLRDRLAVHVLHGEVRQAAVLGDTTVEQARNPGVLEAGQDLTLSNQPFALELAMRAVAMQLDRHLLLELAVGALGEIDGPHAAFADLAHQPVRSDQPATGVGRNGRLARADVERRGHEGSGDGGGGAAQQVTGRLRGGEQLVDLVAKRGVARAEHVETRGPLNGRCVEDRVEDGADATPAFRIEGARHARDPATAQVGLASSR